MTRLGDKRLQDKVPVEPLDANRVARIEQHVLADLRATEFEPLRSRWSLARMAMPVFAVAAVAAVAWLGMRALRPERVERVAVQAPEPPRVEHIATGDGSSRFDLGDAVIEVAANTSFELRREGGGILVLLETGKVECEVEPRGARPPFVVRAGAVDVTVVGTLFSVERDEPDGEVRVHVTHGKVRVDRGGERALVAAGQRWTAAEGVRMADAGKTAAGPEPRLATGGNAALGERTSATPSAPTTRERSRVAKTTRPAPAPTQPEPTRLAAGMAVKPTLTAPMRATATDARKAAAEFLQLALTQSTPSKTAAWALYSKAHVEYFRLRQSATALATLEIFERRFNAGAYTEDALKLRITITCGSDRKHECRSAAHTYLGQFPDGDYREHARAITNWDVR